MSKFTGFKFNDAERALIACLAQHFECNHSGLVRDLLVECAIANGLFIHLAKEVLESRPVGKSDSKKRRSQRESLNGKILTLLAEFSTN